MAADRDPVTIVPHRDGPLIVRGAFVIRTQDGEAIDPGRNTVALCRCGKSRSKPFCDGTHQVAKFRAPSADERRADASTSGGRPAG